ncbi:DUF6011 domain-containing protein [Sporomusa sphaeroides DSM 2875]|uniref:DUF6011 domain-containing protein n=1 Tax=Sporomusa sphaeroides TaxID=47679 RepID=UPI00202E4A7B|nr:DUF6011 domain-containing protein [Sporomusa sphaeroides]MCM0760280.1 DUF6011 domain-containing protein [Sporomusa sphaeroides DSM 2875]
MDELHFCQRCNRRLRSPKAIEDGMGKICKQKTLEEKGLKNIHAEVQKTSIKG